MVRSALMLFACVLPMATGCSDATRPVVPRRPTVDAPAEPPPAPPPAPPEFPPLPRPGDVYVGPDDLYDLLAATHHGRLASRYVFYDNGKFSLQFASSRAGLFEYPGAWAPDGGQITLAFEGWSTAGPWQATATLRGDSLSVKYNIVMYLSDFIDGVYVRSPVTP
jgi:hypothetical protein